MKKSETNLANLEKQLKNSKISDSSSLLQRNFRHDVFVLIILQKILESKGLS